MTIKKWNSHEMNRAQGVLEKVEAVSTGINHIMDDLAALVVYRDEMEKRLDLDKFMEKLAKEDLWLSLSEDQRRGACLALLEWLREGK